MQPATTQETLAEASQLLQGLQPETTAAIDDLLLQASQQLSFVGFFGVCGLVIFYQVSSYYMFLRQQVSNNFTGK